MYVIAVIGTALGAIKKYCLVITVIHLMSYFLHIGWAILRPKQSTDHGLLAKIIRDSVRDRVCMSTAVGIWSPRLLHDVILLCYAVELEVIILCVYKYRYSFVIVLISS